MARWIASVLARLFGFFSGTVRNARTFHPDGRTFFGTVQPQTPDQTLLRAGTMLEGRVLMRIGMGIAKLSAPAWFKNLIPDAPSVAVRFSPSQTDDGISRLDRRDNELDVLFTAGGDRLWKLLANLALGGRCFGLNEFDYLQNRYFAQVPYRIADCGMDGWLRLVPQAHGRNVDADRPRDAETREEGLTAAAPAAPCWSSRRSPPAIRARPSFPSPPSGSSGKSRSTRKRCTSSPSPAAIRAHGILHEAAREGLSRERACTAAGSGRARGARSQRVLLPPVSSVGQNRQAWTNARRFSLRRLACGISLAFVALVAVAAIAAAVRFLPNHPLTNPPDTPDAHHSQSDIDAQRFKYGSTGGEANLGFPLAMWQAAPLVCAETLKSVLGNRLASDYVSRVRNYKAQPNGGPDPIREDLSREGYKAFGIIYEKDQKTGSENDIPVGVSKRRNLGVTRVFVNCAFCHASTIRTSESSTPALVLGMPANTLDIRNFENFLFQCTGGQRFTTQNLIPEIENMSGRLSLFDRYVLYPLATWIVRDRVAFLQSRLGFFARQPEWGPGRVNTFSNAKGIFNWPWQKLPDWSTDRTVEHGQVGTVNFPSIWLQGKRRTRDDGCPMELHWDGNNAFVEERDLSAAFGTGALPVNIDHKNVGKIEDWLLKRSEPPKFPDFFPKNFDRARAENGRAIYQHHCAVCHGADGRDFSGKLVGHVTPIGKIDTDRHRLDNYSEGLAAGQAMLYAGEKKPDPVPNPEPPAAASTCDPGHGDAQENSYRFKRFRRDSRLCQLAAGRNLAARAVPAQRLGAVAVGAAETIREPDARLLPRQRRVRPGESRFPVGPSGATRWPRLFQVRHRRARQFKQGARLRHPPVGRRQVGPGRVPEDILINARSRR